MGNCCCVLRNRDKKFKSSQKPGSKRIKKSYYKYGDDEYDNDDYDDDYDRQTTKSDLSSIKPDVKRPRRLLDKTVLNQHLKSQQIGQLHSSSSSTILLLKQSHLVQPSTSNLEKNFNIELSCKLNENKVRLNDSYNFALNKIKSTSSLGKRWSIISNDLVDNLSEKVKETPLLNDSDEVDDGVDVCDDLDHFDDSSSKLTDSNNQHDLKDRLTDNNSSSDQLIINSISSTVITTSKSSYNDTTPKLIQSCNSMKSTSIDDLTSNSENTDNFGQKRRMVYQKRNSNLNHSLNETDLVINKTKLNKKRKLKQRKIDLDEDENKSFQEDEDYNSDDAVNNKLNKNYLNYRSLQKSKRSIKSIEQTIKNSKSIEKWLNDFDKIKELDQAIPESPQTTIQRSDTTPNDDLYCLFDEDEGSSKLVDSIPKNLVELIEGLNEVNKRESVRQQETDMYNYIKKFVLPKSLANADDINYLKWLLNDKNFTLLMEQPILNKYNSNFIFECKNLNIELVECETDENNFEDQCYIKYLLDKQTLLLDQDKIRYILNKEKELSQTTNLNNQGILESFREKYIQSNNFTAVQSLLNICKKSSSKKSNLSNSCSSSSTSSTPILNTSTQTDSNLIPINFTDLNDKLFLCFLSNYSCKLVDTFLQNTQNITQSNFNSAGFIRKHKLDKSFSYIINEHEFKSFNFKLFIKLNKWPSTYDFMKRLKFIKSKFLSEYIEKQTCLITNQRDEFENSFDEYTTEKWCVDTRLAETVIFKSFNKTQLFYFYYLYNVLNNLKSVIEGGSKRDEFINHRVLLHHFLRFIASNDLGKEPIGLLIQFSSFLRSSISKHSSLNLPNFFNLKLEIQNEEEPKLNEFTELLNKCDSYLKKSSIEKSCLKPGNNVMVTNKVFNEYLTDFFQILFEQFKSKRDHFKINEQVLIDIHERVVQTNENLNYVLSKVDVDISSALLSKFEIYAECVHKYLPQIRQHNQYLLFHYIWTMQVQYLAPFFNYICDLYKSYN